MSLITLFLVMIVVLIVGAAAVAIDRLNFPQKPFQAKELPEGQVVERDRTGAHIIEDEQPELGVGS